MTADKVRRQPSWKHFHTSRSVEVRSDSDAQGAGEVCRAGATLHRLGLGAARGRACTTDRVTRRLSNVDYRMMKEGERTLNVPHEAGLVLHFDRGLCMPEEP